jgi:hypothetical protein
MGLCVTDLWVNRKIWRFHCGGDDIVVLDFDLLQPWRWRHCASPKCVYIRVYTASERRTTSCWISSIDLNCRLPCILEKIPGREFRIVVWDVLPSKIIVVRRFSDTCCLHHQGSSLMIEAAIPLKRQSTIILLGSTSQKTIMNFILAAVRTLNLIAGRFLGPKKRFWHDIDDK